MTEKHIARFARDLNGAGRGRVFTLDPPKDTTLRHGESVQLDRVWVSELNDERGTETAIFAMNATGFISPHEVYLLEGEADYMKALDGFGYEVEE